MGLDPWDRTLDVILERIPESERKQNMSKKEAIEALRKKASQFNKLSKKHDVVVGDLPGIPDELAQIVTRIGTYGIIVCKDDELKKIPEWEKLFSDNNVKLVAVIHTSMKGKENVWQDGNLIRADLVNLNTKIIITPGIQSLASLLQNKLGIQL